MADQRVDAVARHALAEFFDHLALKAAPQSKDLFRFLQRRHGDGRAAVRLDLDKAIGSQP
ncbi:hypothetical protein D3C86_2050560 [compost metagenome]